MPELCATTGVPERTLRMYLPKLHSALATFGPTYSIDNVSGCLNGAAARKTACKSFDASNLKGLHNI
jgi:hypothetical protein